MARQEARQQRQTARQSNKDRQEQGSKARQTRKAGKQDMNTRLPSKAGVQCNKEFESESKCESDDDGKVLRIGHALKINTDHHRFMDPCDIKRTRSEMDILRKRHA